MSNYHNVLIYYSDQSPVNSVAGFLDSELPVFLSGDDLEGKVIENHVHRVTQDPGNLLRHLQRIYSCYRQSKSEQLYAALTDFLTVLEHKGKQLAYRIVHASRNKLDDAQFTALQGYLSGQGQMGLEGNCFSVIQQELVGVRHLLDKSENVSQNYDYLQLAQDYIEYSQLDEALGVLERGLHEVAHREDIQAELIGLYKVTRAEDRFRKTYALARSNQYDLIAGWEDLLHFFDEREK